MKRFISILCAVCMIATMVPLAVMAEDATVTINGAWSGTSDTDVMTYNTTAEKTFSLIPAKGNLEVETYADYYKYCNKSIGGKAANDYYVHFDWNGPDVNYRHYVLYTPSNGTTELATNYVVFKCNIYGREGAFYIRLYDPAKTKATLYKINDTEKALFKDGVWNSFMIVVDNVNNKTYGYINGIKTHINDLGTTLSNANASYTDLASTNLTRFDFVPHGIDDSATGWMYADDFVMLTSTTEPVAPTATVTSSAMAYDDKIAALEGSVSNLASDGNTVIVYNGTDATRAATTAVTDNVVSVEYTDATYGTMYKNYTVKTNIADKFWDGSTAPSIATNGFNFMNANTQEYVNDSLGGKLADDKYMLFTSTTDKNYPFFYNNTISFATRYCTFSLNVYGKAFDFTFVRFSSSDMPNITGTLTDYLLDGKWNNIFIVCDNTTKDVHTYVNNVLVGTKNLTTLCKSYGTLTADKTQYVSKKDSKTYTISFSDVRMKFVHEEGTSNTWRADDLATMYTYYEPKPYDYVTTVTSSDATVKGNTVFLAKGAETATVAANGAVVMVNDGTSWSQTNTVKAGDEIMLVTATPYGNIYPTSNINVIGADYTETIATMDNMSFIQGGYPWVTDENGENGYNVQPTGSGNDVLLTEAADIFGSKLTMKELSVGYNFKNSVQTYYQGSWNKAQVETKSNYLVLEADFAFPNENRVEGFGVSTSGGTSIADGVKYSSKYQARVNHYVWVYDIQEGTYTEYVNGESLYAEPKAAHADFVNGTKTHIRFTANGKTEMDVATQNKLDENGQPIQATNTDGSLKFDDNGNPVYVQENVYGTYTDVLKAYVANIHIYGAASVPEIKTGPALSGAVANYYYPIYDTSEFTVDSIKAIVSDADNVYVYKNRVFEDELTEGSAKVGYYNMIITEKDGIFGYYRVCRMPDANAPYAVDSITNDGDYISIIVINIGETQDLTLVLAETNGNDFVKCNISSKEDIDKGGSHGIKLSGITAGNTVTLYGWDNFTNLKPLGATISMKK